jgi:prephenate dehydratase
MRVAYQGVPGAFGHEACLAFVPDHSPLAVPTFAEVAAAVGRGEAQFGMLPMANSRAGEVPGVRQLIEQAALTVEAEYRLPVRLHLLGLRGASLRGVSTVISHPMALRQCSESLSRLGVDLREAANTALAAKDLAGPEVAALASEAAAAIYKRDLLLRDLQDDPDNHTRFVLVRRS